MKEDNNPFTAPWIKRPFVNQFESYVTRIFDSEVHNFIYSREFGIVGRTPTTPATPEVLASMILMVKPDKAARKALLAKLDRILEKINDPTDDWEEGIVDRLASYFSPRIPPNAKEGAYPKLTGWSYTLPISWGHPRDGDRVREADPISESEVNNAPALQYLQASTYWFVRYGYLGQLAGGMPASPHTLGSHVNQALTDAFNGELRQLPVRNGFTGVISKFCVMVKAKHRPEIIARILGGTIDGLSLPKTDLQLWEDATIDSLLPAYKKLYRSKYYVPFRNQLKVAVIRKENLTAELFDYNRRRGAQTPMQIAADIQEQITKARYFVNQFNERERRNGYVEAHLSDLYMSL
jgi:hypothetical protein